MKGPSIEERKRLQALARQPDETIDFSDIPEITEIPPHATVGKFYRPLKQSVTMRLDADVVAWLKSSGAGYQTRVNQYLRELMTQKPGSRRKRA